MKFLISTVLSCSLLVFTVSCEKFWDQCAHSTGPQETEIRYPGSFRNLEVRDNLDVRWFDSDSIFIRITAGKNLLTNISGKVSDQTLVLKNENRCNWARRYDRPVVEVYSPSPYVIRQDGFGTIVTIDTLRASPLTIKHYGAGHLNLHIHVWELYVDFNAVATCNLEGWASSGAYFMQHVGKIEATDLEMLQCELNMDGENDSRIWVSRRIWGKHLSGRNVYLKGQPQEQVEFSGSGRLIHLP